MDYTSKTRSDVYGISDIYLELLLETEKKEIENIKRKLENKTEINLNERNEILKNNTSIKENIEIKGYTFTVFKALSSLGIKPSMTCKMGMDEFGMVCQNEIQKTRINLFSKIGFGCTDSRIILASNGEPYKLFHKGISKNINYQEIEVLEAKTANSIFIESSLLNNPNRRRVAKFITRIAKENKKKIIFDMNSLDVIVNNKEVCNEIIEIADVVITPYDQAYLFFEDNDRINIMKKAKRKNQVFIMKESKGFNFLKNNDYFFIERTSKPKVYSNQYFSAGVLFGIIMDYKLRDTARIAAFLSDKNIITDSILDELNQLH